MYPHILVAHRVFFTALRISCAPLIHPSLTPKLLSLFTNLTCLFLTLGFDHPTSSSPFTALISKKYGYIDTSLKSQLKSSNYLLLMAWVLHKLEILRDTHTTIHFRSCFWKRTLELDISRRHSSAYYRLISIW